LISIIFNHHNILSEKDLAPRRSHFSKVSNNLFLIRSGAIGNNAIPMLRKALPRAELFPQLSVVIFTPIFRLTYGPSLSYARAV